MSAIIYSMLIICVGVGGLCVVELVLLLFIVVVLYVCKACGVPGKKNGGIWGLK